MSAADDSGYIGWLRDNSMLAHAERTAGRFSGVGRCGRARSPTPIRRGTLGAGALRLDANGFLGVEKSRTPGAPAWSTRWPPATPSSCA
ncbi:hypothetical protein [Actinoplanes aureus]|uniref:Uncharacterized protein n=1 Tax=Actinoplanes aureus TaxID=2792083 RepID=A0A931G3A4_9ACTN|nr:hypothetical protein [Actinoplanes aureus]MBG0564074.1 hypothetical protein [Actinoplanes aureus]